MTTVVYSSRSEDEFLNISCVQQEAAALRHDLTGRAVNVVYCVTVVQGFISLSGTRDMLIYRITFPNVFLVKGPTNDEQSIRMRDLVPCDDIV